MGSVNNVTKKRLLRTLLRKDGSYLDVVLKLPTTAEPFTFFDVTHDKRGANKAQRLKSLELIESQGHVSIRGKSGYYNSPINRWRVTQRLIDFREWYSEYINIASTGH